VRRAYNFHLCSRVTSTHGPGRVDLQFRAPGGEWESIGDDEWAGDYFGGVELLKAKDFVEIDLRLDIHKSAPAGDAWSFGSGAFIDNVQGQDCVAEGYAEFDFVVLAPGADPGDPGEAIPGETKPGEKPGDDKNKPAPDTKPQGGLEELPVSGNLAETGSSSALPTIAMIGGVAMVAGAGAIFVVRRRKTAGTEAAVRHRGPTRTLRSDGPTVRRSARYDRGKPPRYGRGYGSDTAGGRPDGRPPAVRNSVSSAPSGRNRAPAAVPSPPCPGRSRCRCGVSAAAAPSSRADFGS
jgi:LPXTG-motif cell wall-anchored protein